MDDLGGPVNSLDAACRQHDVDYMTGMEPVEADQRLVQAVLDTNLIYYPLFRAVFAAKYYFENTFGRKYTSSLYVIPPGFQPSLNMYFREDSAYWNNLTVQDQKGIFLETRWKSLLKDIWKGECLAAVYSEPQDSDDIDQIDCDTPNEVTGSDQSANKPNEVKPGCTNTEDGSTTNKRKPKAKSSDQRSSTLCKRLINEVLIPKDSDQTDNIFFEIARVCDSQNYNSANRGNLNGHLLGLIIVSQTEAQITMMHRFSKDDNFLGSADDIRNSFYLVGTPEYGSRIQLPNNSVPIDDGDLVISILLYVPSKKMRVTKMNAITHTFPLPLTAFRYSVISEFVIDAFAWGGNCTDFMGETLRKLLPDLQVDCSDFVVTTFNYGAESRSLSRCQTHAAAFQSKDFRKTIPTPWEKNNCSVVDDTFPDNDEEQSGIDQGIQYPHNLQGVAIQSTAQKIILNVMYYVDRAQTNPEMFTGPVDQMAGRIMGIGQKTIKRIQSRVDSGSIATPGKRRRKPCRKQMLIDSFDRMMIRNIIAEMYEKGLPPLLTNIYYTYLHKRKENTALQQRLHDEQPAQCSDPGPDFTISRKVFAKVLRALGFKYGRIDYRLAVIQRPDLVLWRGEYLKVLRKNSISPNPMRLVYLDETWIDPNQRLTKAWVPSKQWGLREKLKYSFKKNKIGRGPRLILLSAVDEFGIIQNATLIYPVAKGRAALDYHDNVDGKAFMKYLGKLLDYLDQFEQKSLIIMDNASYHSTRLVPKKSDTKQVLYDWVQKHMHFKDVEIILPPFKQVLKWELQSMIDTMKTKPSLKNELYRVDKEVARRGHQILRLPPYHCHLNPIELAWNTMKQCVKARNAQQNIKLIEKIAADCLSKIDESEWVKYLQHVHKFEVQHWEQDGFSDYVPPRIVIPVREDDDDDDDDYEDVCNATEGDDEFQIEDDYDAVQEDSNGDLYVPIDDDIEDLTETELLKSIMGFPDHEEIVETERTPCVPRQHVKRRRLDFAAEVEDGRSYLNDQCLDDEELLDV